MTLTDPMLLGAASATGLVDRQDGKTDHPQPVLGDDRDMHLLRLSLDLQLDAMLLVLGASAVSAPETGIPWRRWLDEDVELAWELVTTALTVRTALPSALGVDLANSDPDVIADDLLARYESMCGLMSDLLIRGAERPPEWHANVRQALGRCQERVIEMRDYRHERRLAACRSSSGEYVTAGQDPQESAPPPVYGRQGYLPGELLG